MLPDASNHINPYIFPQLVILFVKEHTRKMIKMINQDIVVYHINPKSTIAHISY